MSVAPLVRPTTPLAPPILLDTAFDEPDRVLALIHRGAPYKTLAAVQKEPRTPDTAPWFRNFWALGGKPLLPDAGPLLANPRFIAAAREVSGPGRAAVGDDDQLNPPSPAGAPDHRSFDGARSGLALWMLAPMGYSGLFQRWAIRSPRRSPEPAGAAGGAFGTGPTGPPWRHALRKAIGRQCGDPGRQRYGLPPGLPGRCG
ncbi:MAG: hypothetical protein R3E68_14970 [Burkholderiaceae bacterium]